MTVELVTTGETYPIWTTARPLVVGSCTKDATVYNYRYCVKTTSGEGVRWEGESISQTTGSVIITADEEGILPLSKTGRVGRKIVKFRSLTVGEGEDSEVMIKDVFEEGFTNAKVDPTALAYNDLHLNPSSPTSPSKGSSGILKSSSNKASTSPCTSSSPIPQPRPEGLFLICYHLPVSVSKDPATNAWKCLWKNSLIAKSEGSVSNSVPTFWVGGLQLPEATEAEKEELRLVLKEMNCFPIFIPSETHSNHYLGMCKQVYWPAFHNIDLLDLSTSGYGNLHEDKNEGNVDMDTDEETPSAWDQVRIQKKWWEAYKEVNDLFLTEVRKHLQPNDTAWIHDYHLALLPKLLEDSETRDYGKRQTHSVFFLHIPFPTSQIFRELECGDSILEGILASDVVGFHTFDYARHFLNACKRIMGLSYESKFGGLIGLQYQGRTVMVTTSHVSVEPSRLNSSLRNTDVHDATTKIKEKHERKTIIGGIDLAQRLSGVMLKFLAYENLLEDYPVYQKKVVLLQRCFANGTRVGDEESTLKSIAKIVSRIKRRFGEDCIDYEVEGEFSMDDRVAIWRSSDVYLGTAIREGLNLMPLEYVFCKQESPGVVVTSEFSAACNILNGALRINPFDVKKTADQIDIALKMEAFERQKRLRRDIQFVSSRTSSQWSKHILKDLKDAVKATAENSGDGVAESWVSEGEISTITHINVSNVVGAYKATKKRVIICDYGGTILSKEAASKYLKRDISATSGRVPRKQVMNALRRLCSDPNNTVFVVSGVNRRELENALGDIEGLGLAASNGACFALPAEKGEKREWQAFQFGVDWEKVKAVALPIMSKYAARTNGSSLKMLDLSISWSFFSCDPEWGKIQADHIVPELTEKVKDLGVQVVTLKGQVEIVPNVLNKGMVTKRILREVAARDGQYPQFLLAIGDDKSDEPMFESVFSFLAEQVEEGPGDGQLSVAPVGSRQSSATSDSGLNPTISVKSPSIRRLSKVDPVLNMPDFIPGEDQYAYTVTVGKKGSTVASEYLHNSREVETLLTYLAFSNSPEELQTLDKRVGSGSWDNAHQVDSSYYDL